MKTSRMRWKSFRSMMRLFHFEPETSTALGFGFRWFIGLLHMEIIVERLERRSTAVVTTSPSVIYKVVMNDGSIEMVQNPSNLPDPTLIDHIEEPMVKADIMVPKEYVGNIMEICQERRGRMLHMEYITENRVNLHYEMPLNEVIYDFFDALKSKTRGYGSFGLRVHSLRAVRSGRLISCSTRIWWMRSP